MKTNWNSISLCAVGSDFPGHESLEIPALSLSHLLLISLPTGSSRPNPFQFKSNVCLISV